MVPERKRLPHEIPGWVGNGAIFFITVCSAPRGLNHLCTPEQSAAIKESIDTLKDKGVWWPHLVLLMPDHMHLLISFAETPGMLASMRSWKRYTAKTAHINWQDGFFDHRLRRDESFVEKAAYIRMNPVRAGLAQNPEEWPHIWEYRQAFQAGGKS